MCPIKSARINNRIYVTVRLWPGIAGVCFAAKLSLTASRTQFSRGNFQQALIMISNRRCGGALGSRPIDFTPLASFRPRKET